PVWVRILTLIAGLTIAALGLLAGSLSIILGSSGDPTAELTMITTGSAILAAAAGLGLAVAWQAWRSIQGKGSALFRPRSGWLLVLAFLLAVAAGQAILSLDRIPALAFAPFHILAGVLPPLALLALAGRGLGGKSRWRDVVLQLGSGGLLATPLAFAVEMVILVGLAIAAVLSLALRPGGMALLERLQALLEAGPWLPDPSQLLPAVVSPWTILIVLAVVAGIVPIIEEAVKSLGVGLMAYRRPGRAQAFLWGVAGGAGFALVEGLLNTAGGLQSWTLVILLRVGGTLLHAFTGGLMGLAWYQLFSRRWKRVAGLYASSVALHSLWNGLSLGIGFLGVGAGEGAQPVVAGLGTAALLGGLIVIALSMGLGLAGMVAWLRRQRPASGEAVASGDQAPQPADSPGEAPGTHGEDARSERR
ncbi:MAG: PrsW family intramembrane metalloprotease, partial [Anaerolineae bacterium]|nr:PrsW family intramembrane metalloprotease [Anaerolineae bacterium]